MWKYRPLCITLITLLTYFSCLNGQDCNRLPSTFSSYEQAVSLVKSSTFKIREGVDTSKSSWIRGATFFSCDGKSGFLIIKTDSKEYIHQNVPIKIWRGFISARSFGSYYSNYIRGKYRLIWFYLKLSHMLNHSNPAITLRYLGITQKELLYTYDVLMQLPIH
jgi:hypothetical protein